MTDPPAKPTFVEICRAHHVRLSDLYVLTDAANIARGTITAMCNGFPVNCHEVDVVLAQLSKITRITWTLNNVNINVVEGESNGSKE